MRKCAGPAADVQGYDTVAKVMVLSALVFGRQLSREEVSCQGITGAPSPFTARVLLDYGGCTGTSCLS
jgi:homoserine dehydrogenase